jgi:hypothetical protein
MLGGSGKLLFDLNEANLPVSASDADILAAMGLPANDEFIQEYITIAAEYFVCPACGALI